MEKNYVDITKRISGDLRKLRQDIPVAAVKKQRLLGINQEFVECEAGSFCGLRQKGRYAIDTITNLVDPNLHMLLL
jgi:hypothetical protein